MNIGERPATPRVTIGLPVYNGEQFLAEALDAIMAQTFEDFDFDPEHSLALVIDFEHQIAPTHREDGHVMLPELLHLLADFRFAASRSLFFV